MPETVEAMTREMATGVAIGALLLGTILLVAQGAVAMMAARILKLVTAAQAETAAAGGTEGDARSEPPERDHRRGRPVQLTPMGERIAKRFGIERWSKEMARRLAPQARGKAPHELHALAGDHVRNEGPGGLRTQDAMAVRALAYEFGIERTAVLDVLQVALRNEFIRQEKDRKRATPASIGEGLLNGTRCRTVRAGPWTADSLATFGGCRESLAAELQQGGAPDVPVVIDTVAVDWRLRAQATGVATALALESGATDVFLADEDDDGWSAVRLAGTGNQPGAGGNRVGERRSYRSKDRSETWYHDDGATDSEARAIAQSGRALGEHILATAGSTDARHFVIQSRRQSRIDRLYHGMRTVIDRPESPLRMTVVGGPDERTGVLGFWRTVIDSLGWSLSGKAGALGPSGEMAAEAAVGAARAKWNGGHTHTVLVVNGIDEWLEGFARRGETARFEAELQATGYFVLVGCTERWDPARHEDVTVPVEVENVDKVAEEGETR